MSPNPTPDPSPGPTLEEMTRDECFRLVRSLEIGRVAVNRPGRSPLVVPVNYALDGENVIFRSDPGTKLTALREQEVSFQIDAIDPFQRAGWSVLIAGQASELTVDDVEHLILEPWAGGAKSTWIRIEPTEVTGRRTRLPAARGDDRGYL